MFVFSEWHYLPHEIGVVFVGGISWLGKYFLGQISNEWHEVKGKIANIESSTRVQAENHLQTIQVNSEKSNELLTKLVEGQAEMNGFLKGRASKGRKL